MLLGKGSLEQPCTYSAVPRAPPARITKMLAVAAVAEGVRLVDRAGCSHCDLSGGGQAEGPC